MSGQKPFFNLRIVGTRTKPKYNRPYYSFLLPKYHHISNGHEMPTLKCGLFFYLRILLTTLSNVHWPSDEAIHRKGLHSMNASFLDAFHSPSSLYLGIVGKPKTSWFVGKNPKVKPPHAGNYRTWTMPYLVCM